MANITRDEATTVIKMLLQHGKIQDSQLWLELRQQAKCTVMNKMHQAVWSSTTATDQEGRYREVEVVKTNKHNLINAVLGIQQEPSFSRQQIFELNHPSSPPETHHNANAKRYRKLELCRETYHDRLASEERKFSASQRPVMMSGDRGHGYNSTIKGQQKWGGLRKQKSHPITSQNGKIKKNNGSFICLHPGCPSQFTVRSRDKVSALAIGLAGAAHLLLGTTFTCFDPGNTFENQRLFFNSARCFLNRKRSLGLPIVEQLFM
ncbi:hypothetical protein [Parasitella parasitica]|uniref:Uncharacterized protein n=1 Tax=Parasitella parasitica TaxID=35722 RepID=A0A0B7NJ67_9FUNG|nr:hypothetical protein [Parasitella parasitica]